MLHSIEIIKEHGRNTYSADVVIDLIGVETSLIRAKVIVVSRCTEGFLDVPVIGDRELRTIFSCGTISSGPIIGYGKYTGMPVAILSENKVIIIGKPFNIYLKKPIYLLEELRYIASLSSRSNLECAKKKIMEFIIRERRTKRISRSVQFLELALRNSDATAIPPFITELFQECNVIKEDDMLSIINQILSELYS